MIEAQVTDGEVMVGKAAATHESVKHRIGKPYLSWVLVVRDSKPDLLERCLRSLRDRTPDAEIVVVETMGKEQARTLEIARRFADVVTTYAGPRGDWTPALDAVDDMAAARQYAFGLARGTWRAWADDDDEVLGGAEAEALLRRTGRFAVPREGERREEPGVGVPVALESVLRWIEANKPDVRLIHCPYAYRFDAQGNVSQWQMRERFCRWEPGKFAWSEAAHEVLVPLDPAYAPYSELPNVVWKHNKVWDAAAEEYSRRRHSRILLEQYSRGERTFRRSRYLAGFAATMPELSHREREFLDSMLALAHTELDRYRAHEALGAYFSRRGLVWDARDHFAAAQALRPDLPDAWLAAGQAAYEREDWVGAVQNLRAAVKLHVGPNSEQNPRDMATRWPSLLSVCLQKLAAAYRDQGHYEIAAAHLVEAAEIAARVAERPEVGEEDLPEAHALRLRAENAANAEKTVLFLHGAWTHLRRNDEPLKALALVRSFPHDREDHPLAVEMQAWARKIEKHRDDPQAYAAFYTDQLQTGWTPLAIEDATYERAHPRNRWAIDWVKKNAPRARVLDLGCCDGICGIPLLRECPEIAYVGVDVAANHIEHFQELLRSTAALGSKAFLRARLEVATFPSDTEPFDVILAGEIVEHVSDPVVWLEKLRERLAPGGTILLTTPWGSFDEGHPPKTHAFGGERDERGHLRAFNVRSLVEVAREAGCFVREVARLDAGQHGLGDAMVARLVSSRDAIVPSGSACVEKPVAVFVPSALWDWSGSTIQRGGMGASETQIKMLGERLAAEGCEFDVFGPVPQQEVFGGVGYFPRAAIRGVERGTKLLVSRLPGAIDHLDALIGEKNPAVLWLQDTNWGQLTDALAERYEAIVCVSEWHAEKTRAVLAPHLRGKVRAIPNHVDERLYLPGIDSGWKGVKKCTEFVYLSSPDRGVVKLLSLWGRVRVFVKEETGEEARLRIFYGWRGAAKLASGADASWNARYIAYKSQYEMLRLQPGVEEVGMASPLRVALALQESCALLYPGDFLETYGTVASEAAAAGCVPVVSHLAGLKESAAVEHSKYAYNVSETAGYLPGFDEEWLEAARKAVRVTIEQRQEMARQAVAKFGWKAVEDKWKAVLSTSRTLREVPR